jgi:hypothetical protein
MPSVGEETARRTEGGVKMAVSISSSSAAVYLVAGTG